MTSVRDVLTVVQLHMRQASVQQARAERAALESQTDQGRASKSDSDGGDAGADRRLLQREADRQALAFDARLAADGLASEPPQTRESRARELALCVAGVRLVHGLPLVVAKSLEQRGDVRDLLEAAVCEFTRKKTADAYLRLQRSLAKAGRRGRRDERAGLHALVGQAGKSMAAFGKCSSGN